MTHEHEHEHEHRREHRREHRNHWDERYASSERPFHADPVDPDESLAELAAGLAPGRALDLGAGLGRNSLFLARRGWRVTAVDLSEVALSRLAAAAAEEELIVETVVGEMAQYLAQGRRFDLVVWSYLHPAPEQRAALLSAAAAAVAPGGHLFLVGHHLESLGRAGPPLPERLYTEDRLDGAFPGLEVLRLERREQAAREAAEPLVDVVAWAARPEGDRS